jgi:hypothetical protein
MLLAEEERLKRASVSSDFSTLLRHDSFHRYRINARHPFVDE